MYLTREVTEMCGKPLRTLCTLSHKKYLKNKPRCIKISPKVYNMKFSKENYSALINKHPSTFGTLSDNFLVNCNTTLSDNFYQERTPRPIIFTIKGHYIELHIPSSHVWECLPPGCNVNIIYMSIFVYNIYVNVNIIYIYIYVFWSPCSNFF